MWSKVPMSFSNTLIHDVYITEMKWYKLILTSPPSLSPISPLSPPPSLSLLSPPPFLLSKIPSIHQLSSHIHLKIWSNVRVTNPRHPSHPTHLFVFPILYHVIIPTSKDVLWDCSNGTMYSVVCFPKSAMDISQTSASHRGTSVSQSVGRSGSEA